MPAPARYTAAIIGAGTIGSAWDKPGSKNVLTYAHAFTKNRRTKLVGMSDIDHARGASEAKRWKTDFYPDTGSLFRNAHPDIIVIATPDLTHVSLLEEALTHAPKLIICEKPIVTNGKDAERVERMLAGSAAPVIVNFPRRFDRTTVRLQEEIRAGAHGTVISARALYAKGTHHIGSHVFDLVRFLFGELTAAEARFKSEDYADDDPTYSGAAAFEGCGEMHIQSMDGRITSVVELEVLTEKRRLRLMDQGYALETQEVIPDPVFKGFKKFGPTKRVSTGLIRAMPNLVEHCVSVLDGRESPRSTALDALKTFQACEAFAASYRPIYHS